MAITTSPERPVAPQTAPPPATRSLYRLLQMKGMAPAEAASLTAYMCGLPTTDLQWTLKQVNQLLFLRRLRETGRFDSTSETTRPT